MLSKVAPCCQLQLQPQPPEFLFWISAGPALWPVPKGLLRRCENRHSTPSPGPPPAHACPTSCPVDMLGDCPVSVSASGSLVSWPFLISLPGSSFSADPENVMRPRAGASTLCCPLTGSAGQGQPRWLAAQTPRPFPPPASAQRHPRTQSPHLPGLPLHLAPISSENAVSAHCPLKSVWARGLQCVHFLPGRRVGPCPGRALCPHRLRFQCHGLVLAPVLSSLASDTVFYCGPCPLTFPSCPKYCPQMPSQNEGQILPFLRPPVTSHGL